MDGSVEAHPVSLSEVHPDAVYPHRFRVPQGSLHGLSQGDKVKRAEKFAMGSLLYKIMTGKEPFEELTDDAVQARFSRAQIPGNTVSLPLSLFILSAWSEDFSQLVNKEGIHKYVPYFLVFHLISSQQSMRKVPATFREYSIMPTRAHILLR